MIDVTFLVLIYFVLTASFALDEGALTMTPVGRDTRPASDPPHATLQIQLRSLADAGCHIDLFVGGRAQRCESFTDLRRRLTDLAGSAFPPAHTAVLIVPEPRTRWQHAVNAYNQVLASGYKQTGYATADDRSPHDTTQEDL